MEIDLPSILLLFGLYFELFYSKHPKKYLLDNLNNILSLEELLLRCKEMYHLLLILLKLSRKIGF